MSRVSVADENTSSLPRNRKTPSAPRLAVSARGRKSLAPATRLAERADSKDARHEKNRTRTAPASPRIHLPRSARARAAVAPKDRRAERHGAIARRRRGREDRR